MRDGTIIIEARDLDERDVVVQLDGSAETIVDIQWFDDCQTCEVVYNDGSVMMRRYDEPVQILSNIRSYPK